MTGQKPPLRAVIIGDGIELDLMLVRGLDTNGHQVWHAFGPAWRPLPQPFTARLYGAYPGVHVEFEVIRDDSGVIRFGPPRQLLRTNN